MDPPWNMEENDDDYTLGRKKIFDQYRSKLFTEYQKGIDPYDTKYKIPVDTITLGLFDKNDVFVPVSELVKRCNCKFICLKIPLNCLESPYAKNHVALPYPTRVVPVCKFNQLKYIILLIMKEQFLIEQSFVNRFPTPNLYHDQINQLSQKYQRLLVNFIFTRTRKIMFSKIESENPNGHATGFKVDENGTRTRIKKFDNDELMEGLDLTLSDEKIYKYIHSCIKPKPVTKHYERDIEDAIGRGN